MNILGALFGLLAKALFVGPQLSGFSWFQLVPGFGHGGAVDGLLAHEGEGWVIATSWFVVALVLGLAGLARMGLDRARARTDASKFIPDASLTPRNFFEILTESLWSMAEGIIGRKEVANFFPLIATAFVYILFTNLLGLVPGVLPPTENISNNFAMAAIVFLVFNYAGLTRNGVAYLKHLGGPIWWMFPFMFCLETLGLFIRPVSLTVRLTANIFADHLVAGAVRELGPGILGEGVAGTIAAALLPAPLLALGLFVCLVQAFVFSLLTTIYIGLSTADMHHDSHDHH